MKTWEVIQNAVSAAVKTLGERSGVDLGDVIPVVEIPKFENQGDFATPVALSLAKRLRRAPIQIAQELHQLLELPEGVFEKVEVARPGYINFFVDFKAYVNGLNQVLKDPYSFLKSDTRHYQKILVEFVSANPTGPLHVGHARGAIYGDALVRVMRVAGYEADAEYYINDRGNQISMLGRSVYLRGKEILGEDIELPENAYRGSYIKEIAQDLIRELGEEYFKRPYESFGPSDRTPFALYAMQRLLQQIKDDLKLLKIEFDNWYSERSLYEPENKVQKLLNILLDKSLIYKDDSGAVLFKSSLFGDDQDRVLVRSNGLPTYFASDMAYHDDKFKRGYGHLINIWGADHHGYIPRMKGILKALGHDPEHLEVLLVQMVSLIRGGQTVPMGKRSGDYYTLKDLIEEVGSDAVRFIFLSRKPDAQMEFDIELARSQSMDNPVYYVQYGHARLRSILDKAGVSIQDLEAKGEMAGLLKYPEEQRIVKRIMTFPYVVQQAAQSRQVHLITFALLDMVKLFHSYYTIYKNTDKVLADDPALRQARLVMAAALAENIKAGLNLLGVSAPFRMKKNED